ncbi:unnamed protein product [marine sediment metagenome]|uniref:Uncharacterized protein n=1 Tax=marine sediment metagenome TaxID=412755 RepID=X1E8D8_9ZZZZ
MYRSAVYDEPLLNELHHLKKKKLNLWAYYPNLSSEMKRSTFLTLMRPRLYVISII